MSGRLAHKEWVGDEHRNKVFLSFAGLLMAASIVVKWRLVR